MARAMDDDTFAHFTAWADDYLHEGSVGEEAEAMLQLFANGDDEDRARWLDQGWPHLRDLVGYVPKR